MTPQDFERAFGRNVVEVIAEIIGLKGWPAMTPEQTFTWLGIGRTAGYEALRRNEIPSVRVGGRILCPTPALVIWLINVDPPNAETPVVATDASAKLTPTPLNSSGRSRAPG